MSALPAEYYARCTDTACTWEVTVTRASGEPDPKQYRNDLAARHTAHYGHTVTTTDYA